MTAVVLSLDAERQSRDHKRMLKLQAKFMGIGYALDPLDGTKLIVQRGEAYQIVRDLAAAERLLAQLGRSA